MEVVTPASSRRSRRLGGVGLWGLAVALWRTLAGEEMDHSATKTTMMMTRQEEEDQKVSTHQLQSQ